jgi:hypothetical protein
VKGNEAIDLCVDKLIAALQEVEGNTGSYKEPYVTSRAQGLESINQSINQSI